MTRPIYQWQELTEGERARLLLRPSQRDDGDIRKVVQGILDRVRTEGDAALAFFSQEFDGVVPDTIQVNEAEFRAAERALTGGAVEAIQLAIDNVRRFHAMQEPSAYSVDTMPGVRCERVPQPLDSVGLYVPAGTAPLPSAAIMLVVPAAIAGCPRRILCTPPRSDGCADPAVLVAAQRGGIDAVYKVGGAQAIAAMAYGTATIPRVAKVFGPGNAWVTTAKTLVAADPDAAAIDMPAGPSEVLVIADAAADAAFVAADLLAQAEHGPDSQVLLVATDRQLVVDVIVEVERQLPALSRREIVTRALDACRMIVARDLDEAVAISNHYAPEHLIVQVENPRRLLPQLRNAGSVFLGPWSPESVGDYCSGTNHVLPTYGQARAFSGLSVDHFVRHMTVQELSRDGLRSLAATVNELATLEGLGAHAAAVDIRLRAPERGRGR